jgi:hypothetical protein
MPHDTQVVLIAGTAAAAIAICVYAIRELLRGRLIPLFVTLGGFLVVFYEPLGDILLGAYYPEVHQVTVVHVFGRDMPLFIMLMYAPYIVPFVILFLHLAKRGFTRGVWWMLWVGTLAATAAMEMIVMQFGHPWLYYGHQPLVVADLPLWVSVTNVTFLFAIGAATHTIGRLDRRYHWLIIPAVPILTVAGHASVALPGAIAITGTADHTLLVLGGLGSIAVAVVISYALSLGFCGRASAPAERAVTPDEATAMRREVARTVA